MLFGRIRSRGGSDVLAAAASGYFGRAAGWDIGIRVDSGPIEESDRAERIAREWGTVENFDKYRISSLIRSRGRELGGEARLFYYNVEGTRGPGGAVIHQLLVESGVPHRYLYEPKREHRWNSGWLPEAIQFLVGLASEGD